MTSGFLFVYLANGGKANLVRASKLRFLSLIYLSTSESFAINPNLLSPRPLFVFPVTLDLTVDFALREACCRLFQSKRRGFT